MVSNTISEAINQWKEAHNRQTLNFSEIGKTREWNFLGHRVSIFGKKTLLSYDNDRWKLQDFNWFSQQARRLGLWGKTRLEHVRGQIKFECRDQPQAAPPLELSNRIDQCWNKRLASIPLFSSKTIQVAGVPRGVKEEDYLNDSPHVVLRVRSRWVKMAEVLAMAHNVENLEIQFRYYGSAPRLALDGIESYLLDKLVIQGFHRTQLYPEEKNYFDTFNKIDLRLEEETDVSENGVYVETMTHEEREQQRRQEYIDSLPWYGKIFAFAYDATKELAPWVVVVLLSRHGGGIFQLFQRGVSYLRV